MRGINRVKRAGEQGGCGRDKWKPNHPFLVGLRQYLMSRHGKGRSEREVNQISSAVPLHIQQYHQGREVPVTHL